MTDDRTYEQRVEAAAQESDTDYSGDGIPKRMIRSLYMDEASRMLAAAGLPEALERAEQYLARLAKVGDIIGHLERERGEFFARAEKAERELEVALKLQLQLANERDEARRQVATRSYSMNQWRSAT